MKYTSQVIPGQGRGKTLGFPTFNLKIPPGFKQKHKYGIYACWVWLPRLASPKPLAKASALHFGPRPVFNDSTPSLEVFVLDYSPNHLITQLTFQLVKYLRPIKNFSSPQALAKQIALDVARVRKILATSH